MPTDTGTEVMKQKQATNEPEISLERRAEILDSILGMVVTHCYDLGELIMLLRPEDYGNDGDRACKLDEQDKDARGDGGFGFFQQLQSSCDKEELRGLLIPHLAQAISYKLDIEVSIAWEKRYRQIQNE